MHSVAKSINILVNKVVLVSVGFLVNSVNSIANLFSLQLWLEQAHNLVGDSLGRPLDAEELTNYHM